jgi:hypothetical protein
MMGTHTAIEDLVLQEISGAFQGFAENNNPRKLKRSLKS